MYKEGDKSVLLQTTACSSNMLQMIAIYTVYGPALRLLYAICGTS